MEPEGQDTALKIILNRTYMSDRDARQLSQTDGESLQEIVGSISDITVTSIICFYIIAPFNGAGLT